MTGIVMGLFVMGLLVGLLAAPAAAQRRPRPPSYAKDANGFVNAGLVKNGAKISVELIGKDAGADRSTGPENVGDNSAHTRYVLWGAPLVYRIELIDELPITQIHIVCSDYQTEACPKDLEIRLPDGAVHKMTLQVLRPQRGKREWPRQSVPVNKTIGWFEVKVLSWYPGAVNAKTGKPAMYGGIGEIEAITSADLEKYLVVTEYNAKAPAYVEGASPRNDYSGVKTVMPRKIPMGTYPGIYLTRDEIVKMREEIKSDPRCKEMLEKLFSECDKLIARGIVHPDPNIPAQMRDRSDAQSRAHDTLSKMAGWMGWAYQLSDNAKYAKCAREILVGYAKLYPNDYKEHKGVHPSDTSKIMAQRLSEAAWLLPLIQSYDMVRNAKCMTDADRKLIEEDLIRHAIRFIQRKRSAKDEVAARDKKSPNWRTEAPTGPRKIVGNWTNFYNAAYVQGGIVLGDQDWIDIGMANTRSNIHTGIGDDGMWGEGAIGYHLFGRHALVACCEALARKGIDLYGFEVCRFKNLFDSPVKYAYPDGTAPGINDSGRASIGGSWQAMAYDFAYLRYADENYGVFVNAAPRQIFQSMGCYFPTVMYRKLPETPLKGLQSLVFDKLGYAILRGEDGGAGTYLLMDYGPHGGGHGHPDKLNLILFADGDELAGEPQGYRYEDRRHREWTRPSIAHWTMSVDKSAQAATTGKLLCFCDAGAIKVMRGVSDGAYPGVVLDRAVVQMPGYVADVYRAHGPAERTFDYPLCFRGKLDALKGVDPKTLKPMGPPTMRGYKHILATEGKRMAANWTGTWRREALAEADPNDAIPDERRKHPANEVKAVVVGAEGTTVYCGQVPGGRHEAVLRRQGKATVFAAVVDPYKASDAVKSAESFGVEGPVPAYGLKVTRADGGTDLIFVRYDQQVGGKLAAVSKGAGIETDALVTVVRLDGGGKAVAIGIVGGTKASCAGKGVSLDAPGIKWAK